MSPIRKADASDVSDDEWALFAPYLTRVREDVGQCEHLMHVTLAAGNRQATAFIATDLPVPTLAAHRP